MTTSLPDELTPLARLLEKDEPKVLVVVGAGVSQGATAAPQASWLGLLKHGIQHLVTTNFIPSQRGDALSASLDAAFKPFNLQAALQHAELIEQNLQTPDSAAFSHWLTTAFHNLKAQEGKSRTLETLRDLQQAGALLLTTNYDGLLSEATNLPPVTWEEHSKFLEVMTRERSGILHIHGHWQHPSSIILGRTSYDRIVKDEDLQAAFKSLWLEWSWLYVGCGDGLDDQNLGRLLEWGKRWGTGARPDYFLAHADKAVALSNRPDKPRNLVSIGYSDHSEIPHILGSLLPQARSWPFILIDENFALFRSPGSSPLSVPFPSQKEYLNGEVPSLATDATVRSRLNEHGWAFVLDVASVGKTTLALRIATAPERQGHPTFYLDLATVDAEDVDAQVDAALRRLSRPKFLLVLDNVHHQPEIARRLWDQWRDHPSGSHLLLLATRIQRVVSTSPAQDLAFFEHHAINAAIELRPTPEDLGSIMRHLYRRVAGPRVKAVPVPSKEALEDWHREYRSALGAFCLAVLNRLSEIQSGNWALPLYAASDWVREKWLKPLDAQNRENVFCLAVFGTQELELHVLNEALPHPGRTNQLLEIGLVAKTERGQFGQYHTFSLREPGWSRLILAAQPLSLDEETILFEAAARHPMTALSLSARLRREGFAGANARLWAYLAAAPDNLLKLLPDLPLTYAANLAQAAKDVGYNQLSQRLWESIEKVPDKLFARAGEMPLNLIVYFLEIAKRHQRDLELLWNDLEDKFALRAWETPLSEVATFLDTAKRHQRVIAPLWEAIEREPDKLAARAWETSLDGAAAFLETAKRHQRITQPLWAAIEREPNKLAARAWETSLGGIAAFLDTAKRHQRITEPLWEAIEREPNRLAERAWGTSLGYLASFLDTAKRHQRVIAPLWEAIEREPNRFAERAWGTSLSYVASFLDTAKRHQRVIAPLWEAIEREPNRLAERAWETSLEHLASFLDTAERHLRDTVPLWEAIEKEPNKLAERAWETPLEHLASFLDTAQRHQRVTAPLWEAIEQEPDKLAERIWETSLEHVASFLDTAQRHQRDAEPLWRTLEREPDKLAERAWETPLEHIASFFNIARRQGREIKPIVEALEGRSELLSARVKDTPVTSLVGFFHYAPDTLIKLAVVDLQATQWDEIPSNETMIGATWVAWRCAKAGREDLKSALVTVLLRRKNPKDFPLQGLGFSNLAWLLRNVPTTATTLVPAFLDVFCTSKWLGGQYTIAALGSLATGLRMLALHQSPEVFRRFLNPSLGIRARKELSRFAQAQEEEQHHIVQFLGCAALIRGISRTDWVDVPLSQISRLPVEVLSHRADATKVESWQFQLWLGLRVVAMMARKSLAVPPAVISQTLGLWRSNFAESSSAPDSFEHNINQNMVSWLERCSRDGQGLLLPEA